MIASMQPWSNILPCIHNPAWQAMAVAAGYGMCWLGSGWIVRCCVGSPPAEEVRQEPEGRNPGSVIGKCENFIIITLVLLGTYEGIGLVLAAKSIARMEAVKKYPSYYLGGTLVNMCWSITVGLVVRALVIGLPT